jgi:hypothetical protein
MIMCSINTTDIALSKCATHCIHLLKQYLGSKVLTQSERAGAVFTTFLNLATWKIPHHTNSFFMIIYDMHTCTSSQINVT